MPMNRMPVDLVAVILSFTNMLSQFQLHRRWKSLIDIHSCYNIWTWEILKAFQIRIGFSSNFYFPLQFALSQAGYFSDRCQVGKTDCCWKYFKGVISFIHSIESFERLLWNQKSLARSLLPRSRHGEM